MQQKAAARIHALEIPVRGMSLLIPSASIAEVANVPELAPVPLSPAWVLGAIGWRTLAVPVVSFEVLMGAPAAAPAPASKAIVFYPLGGRREWEFFAILSASEPRPQAVDPAIAIAATAADLPDSPYVAAGLKVGDKLMLIPDFAALRKAFYP